MKACACLHGNQTPTSRSVSSHNLKIGFRFGISLASRPRPHHVNTISRPPSSVAASSSDSNREGSFYESPIVMDEATKILKDFETLSGMMSKYAFFDIEGKKIYLQQMEGLCEKLRIFYTRASLSDDPLIKDSLNQLSKQLLFVSTNISAIYDGVQKQVDDLRKLLAEEEKIVDVQQLQIFRQELAKALPSSQMDSISKNLNMENVMKDPYLMQVLSTNPKALLAVEEMIQKGPSALENYKNDPELYSVLKKLFELN